MKDPHSVIQSIRLSEKATRLGETNNEYVFLVSPQANKKTIKPPPDRSAVDSGTFSNAMKKPPIQRTANLESRWDVDRLTRYRTPAITGVMTSTPTGPKAANPSLAQKLALKLASVEPL